MEYIWESNNIEKKYILDKYPIKNLESYEENNYIKVNHRLRFKEIFDVFFENKHFLEKEEFINIIFYLLREIDKKSFIDIKTIERELIFKDILKGHFGMNLKNNFNLFSDNEKLVVLSGLIESLEEVNTLELFENIVKKIFKRGSKLYFFKSNKRFYIYLGAEKTEVNIEKINLIKELFWDVSYDLEIYFDEHFGILDYRETMIIGNIMLD